MAVVIRRMDAAPEQVSAVIADGWLFPSWVVGAARMREVEPDWPAPGARLHHSFGIWPLLIDDVTESLEWDPGRRAVFEPRGRPLGEGRVEIDIRPRGTGCVVRLRETPIRGPVALAAPIVQPALGIRNRETLRRLDHLASGRAR